MGHEHFMRNLLLDGFPHRSGSSSTGQNDVADNPRRSLPNISSPLVLSVNNHLSKYGEPIYTRACLVWGIGNGGECAVGRRVEGSPQESPRESENGVRVQKAVEKC